MLIHPLFMLHMDYASWALTPPNILSYEPLNKKLRKIVQKNVLKKEAMRKIHLPKNSNASIYFFFLSFFEDGEKVTKSHHSHIL